MNADNSSLDHPFWKFSLSVYSKEGVPAELIALQDTFDIDVNMALFCLWLGREAGCQLSAEQLSAITARSTPWHIETVIPLRGARRYLKSGNAAQTIAQSAADLRLQIKRLELLAEKIEQAILYDWFVDQKMQMSAGGTHAAIENLTLFIRQSVSGWNSERTQAVFAVTLEASSQITN